ncbi:SCO2322 family protein [Streptomyces sp. TRM 70361]|uniref:SCO2322 family protein n=1 Tax=Streptomyces sp. TRM 70361 TaxID=3116553 RepID=UPI002E7B3580|nr:SCO2322 family protein [Streptomyces sp. TRM 70361]MEE1939827.1 SCO2322 family protein [Streptomyces sp. TRM 70361]
MTAPRRTLPGAVLLCALLAAVLAAAGAAPAHAAGYRYWSFWEHDGRQWTYATQGPGTLRPVDGEVLGFRFAVGEDSADVDRPRGESSFAAICGRADPAPGTKRIALSVDFGTPADAPSGETPPKGRTACARVPADGTAADALAAVLRPLRYDSGSLLCAIAGYPRTGCGEQVANDAPVKGGEGAGGQEAAGGGEDSGGPAAGLAAGAAAVAVLGAAAVWQARRRRS